MKALVATTGEKAQAEAGAIALGEGNAVDAVTAAALAWPPSLASAGALLATGAGMGRVCCRFPARVPGLGLSRPRRVRLFSTGVLAALAATPSVAPGLAAAESRWGKSGFRAALRAVRKASKELPHDEALGELVDAGAATAVKGTWSLVAARVLGPVAGGLLTRRDLIEAKPDLSEVATFGSYSSSGPIDPPPPERRGKGGEPRTFYVIAVDRQGAVAALALDAGAYLDGMPTVLGVPANTLLDGQPSGTARRVGRLLPPSYGTAVGIEPPRLALCGTLRRLGVILRSEDPTEAISGAEDLLAVGPGFPASVAGATATVVL